MRTRFAWLDTETTGLYPERGARVIEVAVVVTDIDLVPIRNGEYVTKIQLPAEDWANAQPDALRVNGYTPELWAGAPMTSEEVWRPVQQLTNGAVLAGQNLPFDESMIIAEFDRYGMKPTWNRRRLEMMTFTSMIGEFLGLPKRGLHDVYDALGGPPLPPHQARADIQRCHYVYRLFLNSIRQVVSGRTREIKLASGS